MKAIIVAVPGIMQGPGHLGCHPGTLPTILGLERDDVNKPRSPLPGAREVLAEWRPLFFVVFNPSVNPRLALNQASAFSVSISPFIF